MDSKVAPDAKARLKWTLQLHQQFVDAVSQLGGVDKATPKSVMRVMGIPGLTLYHLKSHLQKYRLAKNQESGNRNEDGKLTNQENDEAESPCGSMLKMQIEVQRKIQEQIEVQKHLQIRIEAQGKYLQSVLKKAQEALAGYSLNAAAASAIETAKAELSEMECLSSCISRDTPARHGDCSGGESCLTSGDVLETKHGSTAKQEGSSSAFDSSGESDEWHLKSLKRAQKDMSDEFCDRRSKRSGFVVHGEDMAERVRDGECCSRQGEEQELDLNM